MSIQSFSDRVTEEFFETGALPKGCGWRAISSVASRRLDVLHAARSLGELANPGNRLERLQGQLSGWYSIRINDRWRVVFRWTAQGPSEVYIVDYH